MEKHAILKHASKNRHATKEVSIPRALKYIGRECLKCLATILVYISGRDPQRAICNKTFPTPIPKSIKTYITWPLQEGLLDEFPLVHGAIILLSVERRSVGYMVWLVHEMLLH